MKKIEQPPSEGEIFIADYFRREGFAFTQEQEIVGLTNDSKKYRKVDFYLVKLDIYVEFYGLWNNSKEDRERYREKKRVYSENKIPCVYIYPENLGIIEFVFIKRAIEVLKNHKMRKELLSFRLKLFWLYKQENLLWLFLALSILIFGDFTWEEDDIILIALVIMVLYQINNIYVWFKNQIN